jgi:DNA-binding NarL/FixJ family response regulator
MQPPSRVPESSLGDTAAPSAASGVVPRGPARVGIVEDDAVLREALVRHVAATGEFVVVGTAETRAAGLQLLSLGLDLLLVDLALPDGNGVDLIRHIHANGLSCRSLVVTVLGDVTTVVRAIEAGADGYLLKAGGDPEQVLVALRTVLSGGAPISPAVARHILGQLRAPSQTAPKASKPKAALALTGRELEMLESLAKGLSYKEVAQLHAISHHTVAEHVKVIYKKLEVNSRAEAVFEALHSGILRLPR